MTPDQQRRQELDARVNRLDREKYFKKGYRSLDLGRIQSYALIDQLIELEPVEMVCQVFDIHKFCYYYYRRRRNRVDVERVKLKVRINSAFTQSRSAAGN